MAYNQDYGTPINQNVESGAEHPAVKCAIDMIQRNNVIKTSRDAKNRNIQRMFEMGFEVRSPDGAKKINSKLLQQALWRVWNKMKPLDFQLFMSGASDLKNKLVTDGVATTMSNGGLISCLRDKGGVFQKMGMFGDSFFQVGGNPEDNPMIPIVFQILSNSNIYFDTYASAMRNGGYGQKVTKMCVIRSMSWESACKMYPEIAKKGGGGKIPRSDSSFQELERNKVLPTELEKDFTEIGYFYDLDELTYTVFEGTQCTILEEFKGKTGKKPYPFIMASTDEAYIPIIHNFCLPSSEGFYNHGIGEMLYDIAIVTQRMMNMGVGHIDDNTYPMTLINVPKGKAGEFFNKLRSGYEMRAKGFKGYVAMEYDPNAPNQSGVKAESLLTPSLMNDWQLVYTKLEQEVKRLGINLDDVGRTGQVTATQLLQEEETSDDFVKQIMENNASEQKFTIEVCLDLIKKLVKTTDETPINSTTVFKDESGAPVKLSEITLGALSDAIRKNNVFVQMDSRSGAIPSNLMKQTKLMRVLSSVPPGSPAWTKLMVQFAQLNDADISEGDIAPQAAPQMAPEAENAAENTQEGGVEEPPTQGMNMEKLNNQSMQALTPAM